MAIMGMTTASAQESSARGENIGILEEMWFDAKPQSQSRIPLRRSSAPPPPAEPIDDKLADGWFR